MKRNILLVFYCIWHAWCWAQSGPIRGVVTDESGSPLAGVTVSLKGAPGGTQTDDEGMFVIDAGRNTTLEFSLMGFDKQSVNIENRSSIEIKLHESQSSLDEVVIIGYQQVTRKKTTAAISSISGKELANLPAASFDQLLQGRLAGVNVQNFTGEPGATPVVQVRGNTSLSREYDEFSVGNAPLYVVDGVPQPPQQYTSPQTGTGTNFIAGINPQDIESIDVLKDASAAAIYGSRAANGVIMITTKKGRSTEPQVMVSAYTGLTSRPELRDVVVGAEERRQKMRLLEDLKPLRDGGESGGIDYRRLSYLLTDSLNPAFNGQTDWQDLFYRTGRINSADLSLSGGGTGGTNYRFSAGLYDEDGIVKATGFKRYSMRLNLMSRALKEKLMINPIVAYTRTDRSRGGGEGIRTDARWTPASYFNLSDTRRDYLLGMYNEDLDVNIGNQLTFNLNLGYEFSKALQFTSQTSYIYSNSRRDVSQPNAVTNFTGNEQNVFSDNQVNFLSSNYFSYTKSLQKHNLSGILGSDLEYNQYRSVDAGATNGSSDQIQVIQGFQQRYLSASSDYQAYSMASFYSRLAYDYDSRYLLSASIRGDGSSRFGKNNKWGYFPSVSVAWLASEESFMENSAFSLLKLRASLGTSGGLPGNNYLQYNLYRVNAGNYWGNNGATSYNGITAITPNLVDGVAQPNISWERSVQWNIGVDGEVANGRFSFAFDVFNKENKQSLFDVVLPITTGYDRALTNSIGVRNYGAEAILMANPLPRTSPVQWFSRLNISYVRNKIMNLPNSGRDLVVTGSRFDKTHILSVGSPINTFYLYETLGIYSTVDDIPINPLTGDRFSGGGAYQPGDMFLRDVDGDFIIDPFNDGINPDKLPIGDPNPKWTGGWTNNFTWKNFTLGLLFNFAFDRDVLNLYASDLYENGAGTNGTGTYAQYAIPDLSKVNIWRKPGDQAEVPAYPLGSFRYYSVAGQTYFLDRGDYLRIKSVSLAYNLPSSFLSRVGMDNVRVYGIADNLAMFQRSSRLPDAEAVNYWGEYSGDGYPIPTRFTFGIELQF
ncbi:SusC/RagA family TonB-linked outer membrane protein [Parapedobacter pyrenivorans]|uniref:SusC/RagA family TonB-linked outer membrane protein n=1 Tax=Parapedobacter pyrenivorans TaxID=1305674 RepID=UPI00166A24B4|nr:SusC/RagA family TonB-linked outer membrane protein [Parapedobacter pyrenivorans]